jgi:hypothetical protein
MAARTPSTLERENVGSLTLHIATFTDIDNADTYASGIQGVVGFWFQQTDDAADTQFGVAVSESSGTFTFNTDEDDKTGSLYVLSRS